MPSRTFRAASTAIARSPAWHQNLRRARHRARVAAKRGDITSLQASRLADHHGSELPKMTWTAPTWTCKKCSAMNWAHHSSCYRCWVGKGAKHGATDIAGQQMPASKDQNAQQPQRQQSQHDTAQNKSGNHKHPLDLHPQGHPSGPPWGQYFYKLA